MTYTFVCRISSRTRTSNIQSSVTALLVAWNANSCWQVPRPQHSQSLLSGVGRVRYQTISGPHGDPFRYLSISVPHETRCRVRDHHHYRFGTTSSAPTGPLRCQVTAPSTRSIISMAYSNWAVLTKFGTETDLVPNWTRYRNGTTGTELDGYRSSHVVPNTSFWVPKWFGTERVWYRTWRNPSVRVSTNGKVPKNETAFPSLTNH